MTAVATAIVVRKAAVEDAPVLAELGDRTFRNAFSASNKTRDIELYVQKAFSIETVHRELADRRNAFLMAIDARIPIGYAKLRDGPVPVQLNGDYSIELHRLYVEAGAIGQGVGAALMRGCLERAEAGGADSIWLGVWERNVHAIEFYRRWGFEVVGSQVFQLGSDSQTDLIMSRQVDGGFHCGPSVAAVKRLLEAAQLPATDIDAEKLNTFFYSRRGDRISGLVGLEVHGPDALLRSLVVEDEWRSKGLGARLVAHAEAFAKASHVSRIYLLTTTALRYFERLGYAESPRTLVPDTIRRTTEFSELCPSSSTLMVKHLES